MEIEPFIDHLVHRSRIQHRVIPAGHKPTKGKGLFASVGTSRFQGCCHGPMALLDRLRIQTNSTTIHRRSDHTNKTRSFEHPRAPGNSALKSAMECSFSMCEEDEPGRDPLMRLIHSITGRTPGKCSARVCLQGSCYKDTCRSNSALIINKVSA